jgi:hypothetical protein
LVRWADVAEEWSHRKMTNAWGLMIVEIRIEGNESYRGTEEEGRCIVMRT